MRLITIMMNAKLLTRTTLTESESERFDHGLGGDSEGAHLRPAETSGVQTRKHRDSCSAAVLAPRPATSDATAVVTSQLIRDSFVQFAVSNPSSLHREPTMLRCSHIKINWQ